MGIFTWKSWKLNVERLTAEDCFTWNVDLITDVRSEIRNSHFCKDTVYESFHSVASQHGAHRNVHSFVVIIDVGKKEPHSKNIASSMVLPLTHRL